MVREEFPSYVSINLNCFSNQVRGREIVYWDKKEKDKEKG